MEYTVIITNHFNHNEYTNLVTYILFKIGNVKQYKNINISIIYADWEIIKIIVINILWKRLDINTDDRTGLSKYQTDVAISVLIYVKFENETKDSGEYIIMTGTPPNNYFSTARQQILFTEKLRNWWKIWNLGAWAS